MNKETNQPRAESLYNKDKSVEQINEGVTEVIPRISRETWEALFERNHETQGGICENLSL